MEKRYVLALQVQNKVGVLSRINALLTRRGFNIDSMSAAETDNPDIFWIIVAFRADESNAEQIKRQLSKQIDVYKILDLRAPDAVTREHIMIKVAAKPEERSSIISVAGIFRANVIDVSPSSMIIELTGETTKTKAFLETIKTFGILEVARSGIIGMNRLDVPEEEEEYI